MEAGSQIWSSMLGTQGVEPMLQFMSKDYLQSIVSCPGRDQLNVLFSLQLIGWVPPHYEGQSALLKVYQLKC